MDTHVEAGASIPPNYDSLIAKLIVWDDDRPAAIARGAACARRARGRGDRDDARFRDAGAAQRGVRERRLQRRRSSTSMALSRKAGRRTALFLLYQWDLTGQPLGHELRGRDRRVRARPGRGRRGARARARRADLSSVSGDWPAKQLGTLERNILRIGVYELEQGTVPARGGDRRGGLAGEAVRVRGRGPARERHPRGAGETVSEMDIQETGRPAGGAAPEARGLRVAGGGGRSPRRVRRRRQGTDRGDRPGEAGGRCTRLTS